LYPAGATLQPPVQIPYDDGQTIPSGYDLKTRSVRSLILAGSLTFGAAYVTSAIFGGVDAPLRALLAPVVGPFVGIGTSHADAMGTLWLALDGMAQTAGVVLFVQGMVTSEKYLERQGKKTALDVLAHPQIVVGPRAGAARWAF
jgi:hypothetical protein